MLQIVAFIMTEIWKGASGLSASSYSKDSFAVNGDKAYVHRTLCGPLR